MGKTIELIASDGHKFQAYRADPSGTPRGAVVVLQEIFGVNRHMRRVTDDFAKDGYIAICPALFDRGTRGVELGYEPSDIAKGREFRAQVPTEGALADIQACINEAAKSGKKVGVVGYCWGGSLSWLAATRLSGLAAAVSYYGGNVAETREEKPKVPVQFHFGDKDASIPMADVEKIKAAQPDVPLFVYPGAGHGFSCEDRASFHPEADKLALERTMKFFGETLG